MSRNIAALLMCSMLCSCSVGPDYRKPETTVGADWHRLDTSLTVTDPVQEKWWENFQDATLTQLIDQAAENNHDLRVAVANIARARADRAAARAAFLPSENIGGSAAREGLSAQNSRTNFTGERERDSFDASLDASWEIDIFGHTRRSVEASNALLEAAIENKRDVLVAIFAEVSRNYFEVRGLQKRIDYKKRNIELLREVEKLAEAQFNTGTVTEIDVARARGEREANEATLPNLEAEMMAGIYRISTLTGQLPEYHVKTLEATKPLPDVPDLVPIGLRSDLLRRRPDIRRAERELAASNAEIGVAIADMFPRFSLSGSAGSSARSFGDMFSTGSFTYLLSSAVDWTILNGGQRIAAVDAARARNDASLASYEKTVLQAVADTQSALTRYGKEWQTEKQLKAAEKTREEAFRIAKLRYEAGEENFLVILDAERSLITAQDELIQSETRLRTNLTQLYKTLGGGWETYEK